MTPQSMLDKVTADSHVPVALLVFLVVSAYHFATGHDIGANYVSAVIATYGFLLGHGLGRAKWGNGNGHTDGGDPPKA